MYRRPLAGRNIIKTLQPWERIAITVITKRRSAFKPSIMDALDHDHDPLSTSLGPYNGPTSLMSSRLHWLQYTPFSFLKNIE